MQILCVAHSAELTGGAEDDFLRLIKYLSQKGYTVDVLTPDGPRIKEYYKYSNSINKYSWGFFPLIYTNPFRYMKYFVKFILQCIEISISLKNKKYDLSILNVSVILAPLFILYFKNFKPIVYIRETIEPLIFRKMVLKIIGRYSIYCFSVSESIANDYRFYTKKNNITTVYSAIEDDDCSETDLNNLKHVLNKEIYKIITLRKYYKILTIGGISEIKNQGLIVKALKNIRDINTSRTPVVICAGKIENKLKYVSKIELFVKKHSLNNSFFMIGETTKKDIHQLIKLADVIVISSKSEGMPLVLVEAFKYKIPLISTNVGGISEVLKHNHNGVIFNTDKELVNAILKLMDDQEYKTKLIDNAFETYKSFFNLNKNLSIIESIIKSLL